MSKVPLTVRGAEKLRAELQQLKSVERPRIIQAIAEARAHGDLKENAEYHAAREQQSFVEGRIKEIEGKLSHAQIIDVTKMPATGKVVFGATVVIADEDDEHRTVTLVGEDEADASNGRISWRSPLAHALKGANVGDCRTVRLPAGPKEYEVIEIRYPD